MKKELDDLEAVRTLVSTLEGFEKAEQERIIRWTREKLGLPSVTPGTPLVHGADKPFKSSETPLTGISAGGSKDIKAFVDEKRPISDNHFVATVAYYYRFEAPEAERKDVITADDIQDACRKADRDRLKFPAQTLINAYSAGLLDKAERGAYAINSVGENLVAMTLPGEPAGGSGKKRGIRKKMKVKKSFSKIKRGSAKLTSK
jgi:hypothetical protein